MSDEKVRENKVRRKLERMGYRLEKSRRRDPDAIDYGLYAIVDPETHGLMHPSASWGAHALTLDEVEQWANETGPTIVAERRPPYGGTR